MGDLCAGSGVVVEDQRVGVANAHPVPYEVRLALCMECDRLWPVEPVEPEGTTPRYRIVDHREAA